jgi:NADH:ubiquinone oxidoreductase subunit 2 (subunit N)
MYVITEYFFTIFLSILLLVSALSSIEENLKKLLFYSLMGQLSYLMVVIFYITTIEKLEFEFIIINFFYIFFNIILYSSFFLSVLYMKRGGNSYKVKSIYDLAQLWITDRKTTISFLILLVNISGIPFLPGFLCKWFFVEEIFFFHKYLGLVSFFISIFMSFPYLRIINQMLFNKNLMSNPKGPRWFFDRLLNRYQIAFLGLVTFFCVVVTINPSILWYFSYYCVEKLFNLDLPHFVIN